MEPIDKLVNFLKGNHTWTRLYKPGEITDPISKAIEKSGENMGKTMADAMESNKAVAKIQLGQGVELSLPITTQIKGEKGEKGEKGNPGKDSDEEKIIREVLKKIVLPKDGKDADEDRIVRSILGQLKRPKDGKDAVVDYGYIVDETLKAIADEYPGWKPMTEFEIQEMIREAVPKVNGFTKADRRGIIEELKKEVQKLASNAKNVSYSLWQRAIGVKNLDDVDLTAPTNGQALTYSNGKWVNSTVSVDHGGLTGLSDDDHTQYALLAGRGSGQTLIGGTSTTADLTLQTTSGVGTTGADMHFLVGNNGATEAMTILNNGNVGINSTAPSSLLTLASTASLESAVLGSELASSNWTTTGWTGSFAAGFTHTTGNTTSLTNTLAAVTNNLYQISYTVTGRTAGSFTINFGGESNSGLTATGTWGPKATSTGTFSIAPTTDFDGTIVISVKQITGTYSPTYAILNSAGSAAFEIRSTTNGLYNTFIGVGAGRYNTTGSYNSAQGFQALYSNTTGSYNSAQGYRALFYNTTGSYNSAQGSYALISNTTGINNSAQGYGALYSNTTGYYNSALGVNSLFSNTTGYYNAALGYTALYRNTTGYHNVAQGFAALHSNTTGSNNVAIGREAGRYQADGSTALTDPENSVYIGYNAKGYSNADYNSIVIGYNAIGLGANTTVLGNSSTTITSIYGAIRINERSSAPSDPPEGTSVVWQSDATGGGGDGDIMMKITAGGVTKTVTIVDFSTLS